MYEEKSISVEVGGRELIFSTRKYAKQADGAFWVRYGDSVVLVTACMDNKDNEEVDFLPFTVDYREYTFAGGKIPGGFIKREGKPTDSEILVARLIDRPLRPIFPKELTKEVQVIAMVFSCDYENTPDIMAMNGASFALYCSRIPFNTPVGAVRIGYKDGQFLVNPSQKIIDELDLNIVVAGTKEAICMVEAGAKEVDEKIIIESLKIAHENIKKIVEVQEKIFNELNIEKVEIKKKEFDPELYNKIEETIKEPLRKAMEVKGKKAMYKAIDDVIEGLLLQFEEDKKKEAKSIAEDILIKTFRKMILEEGRRADGRFFDEIRPIWCEVGILPRTHGSAIFARGETMALANCTLGTTQDAQRLSGLMEGQEKHFILHYNFPPFSVGEVKPLKGPGRREVGHGALAERALLPVVPDEKSFPYTIRVVSDILESNGSSSQATICGGSLALMDAGVPIKAPVAGIAMGLIMENDKYAILTDIAGLEDHYGDMDFKVAGTEKGITALQMDIKITGVSFEIMKEALEQARVARIQVLNEMAKVLDKPRSDLSKYAPRVFTIQIPKDKIGEVIGPGGKNVRAIQEQTGVEIFIEEDGTVLISSVDASQAEKAIEIIKLQTEEPEVGKTYEGIVKRIEPYGAIIEILPGTDGLLHVSEIDWKRVHKVEDYLKVGDKVHVQILDIEKNGKMKLSRKSLLPKPEHFVEKSSPFKRQDRSSHQAHNRPPRSNEQKNNNPQKPS